MALTVEQIKLLNNATPGLFRAKLGDVLADALTAPTATKAGVIVSGAVVPNAAAAPTQAEFNALLTALRANGVLRTA